MADYFSNIADRSAEYQPAALVPVQNTAQNSPIDFEEIIGENTALTNNFEAVNTEKTATLSPNSTNDKPTTINKTSNYFTNSYERNGYENGPILLERSDFNTKVNFQNEQIVGKNIQENNNFENHLVDFEAKPNINPKTSKNIINQENLKPVEKRNIENDLQEIDKIEQNILSEKPTILQPSLEKNPPKNALQKSASHTEAMKNMLLPQKKQAEISAKTDNKSDSPKLIIGKINVEILSVNQPVTKIINRVVNSQAPTTFPKTNRNIFGLGQL